MADNRKFICAGCSNHFPSTSTVFYRNKRWCKSDECKQVIDMKVRNYNYKNAQKKIKKGTFRHGVKEELRAYIKARDKFSCRNCFTTAENNYFQVHHIVPVSNGGEDNYENLILLCDKCHTRVHQYGWELYVKTFTNYTSRLHIKI